MDLEILANFEEEELLAELKRRRDLEKPKPIENPDLTELIDSCDKYVIDPIHQNGWYSKRYWQAIALKAITCFYGPEIEDYIYDKWEDC